jgi:alpha-1,3-mannosyltransferase
MPPRSSKKKRPLEPSRKVYKASDVLKIPFSLLLDPKYFWHLGGLLLLCELVLNTLIIKKVSCKKNAYRVIRTVNIR